MENVFRQENSPKKTTEHWQCGVELIGTDMPQADVELILLAVEILKKLGFEKPHLHLSIPGIIKEILFNSRVQKNKLKEIIHLIRNKNFSDLEKLTDNIKGLEKSYNDVNKKKSKLTQDLEKLIKLVKG